MIEDNRNNNLIAKWHSEKVIDITKQPIEKSRDRYKENNYVKNVKNIVNQVTCEKNANGNINGQNEASKINEHKDFETVKAKKGGTKKRSTTVIGDSLLKDIKPFKMRKALPNERIYVKSFPGSTIECMKDYIKPSLKYDPEQILIHIGTNDLRREKEPNEIAEEIIQLALNIKSDENDVSISAILPRNDELNEKGMLVNDVLKVKCSEYNIGFMNNDNFKANVHLNNSGIHLNFKGNAMLAKNILSHIKL